MWVIVLCWDVMGEDMASCLFPWWWSRGEGRMRLMEKALQATSSHHCYVLISS